MRIITMQYEDNNHNISHQFDLSRISRMRETRIDVDFLNHSTRKFMLIIINMIIIIIIIII